LRPEKKEDPREKDLNRGSSKGKKNEEKESKRKKLRERERN